MAMARHLACCPWIGAKGCGRFNIIRKMELIFGYLTAISVLSLGLLAESRQIRKEMPSPVHSLGVALLNFSHSAANVQRH